MATHNTKHTFQTEENIFPIVGSMHHVILNLHSYQHRKNWGSFEHILYFSSRLKCKISPYLWYFNRKNHQTYIMKNRSDRRTNTKKALFKYILEDYIRPIFLFWVKSINETSSQWTWDFVWFSFPGSEIPKLGGGEWEKKTLHDNGH